jgi:3-deoxy-D-manno-octulosonic acid (KDO) 8-phosphate synthase
MEVHQSPKNALSDASSMIDFNQLKEIVKVIKKIRGAIDG